MEKIIGFAQGEPVYEKRTAHGKDGKFISGSSKAGAGAWAAGKTSGPTHAEIIYKNITHPRLYANARKPANETGAKKAKGDVSSSAHAASATAWRSGKKEHHEAAQKLHLDAAAHHKKAGNTGSAANHQHDAKKHGDYLNGTLHRLSPKYDWHK